MQRFCICMMCLVQYFDAFTLKTDDEHTLYKISEHIENKSRVYKILYLHFKLTLKPLR